MANITRTFLAIAVPESLELKLTRLQSQLAGEVPEGRWLVTRPFHVTLAFLGDVDVSDLNAVCLATAETAAPFGRLEIELRGLGAFPTPARPRVVWTGVGGPGLEALNDIQAAVAGAAARVGYPGDTRAFHAHVTLGRFSPGGRKPSRDLTPLLNHYKPWHAGPFTVSEVVVFSSSDTREGDVYAPLGRAPLKGRKPGASA
jgi:RNA 2',3'-cyclic 3'-phosphodiesterase